MKSNLGQFFTKNYEYLLSNMEIPDDIEIIIESFCGDGDLRLYIRML